MDPTNFFLGKFDPRGPPLGIQNGDEITRTPGGRNSNMAMAALKISRKCCPQQHQPYNLPTWGQMKTLTNEVKNLVSQQEMPQSPENLLTMLAPLACTTPA